MGDFFVVVNYLILGPPHPGVVMNYETPLPFFVNICQHLPSPYPLFGRRLICKRSLKLAVRPLKDLYVYDNRDSPETVQRQSKTKKSPESRDSPETVQRLRLRQSRV